MKRRKLILTGLFAVSLATSTIVGCSNQSASNSNDPNKKVLTLVTSPDYPPYEFYDTASGGRTIVGFDIDIANYIAKELGLELKVQESDFNGLIPAIQANRADFVMAGMTPTDERKKNADFSTLYFQAQDTIVAPVGSNLKKLEALAGKRIGVQLGSIQEGNIKKIAEKVKGIEVKPLNKIPEIVQEVKAKRIDGAIIENTVAEGFLKANPDLEFTVIPSEGPSGSAIAFPKGSPRVADFNKVLQKMKENGELDRLAKKWFSQSIPPSPAASPSTSPSPSPSK